MKTAYVTGTDRGLGLALVRGLLARNYRVFAGCYLPEWHELAESAQEYPDALMIVPLDVANDESVRAAAQIIATHTNTLDVLINNAGIHPNHHPDIFGELDYGSMLKVYNTNSLGPLRVTHSVLDMLLRGGSRRLINISSEAGSLSANWRTDNYGYTMSKAALNMQSVILQHHLKDYGIKVLAIHPGWVRSYMSGVLNEEATVEPATAALGIIEQFEGQHELTGPIYMDYEGTLMEW